MHTKPQEKNRTQNSFVLLRALRGYDVRRRPRCNQLFLCAVLPLGNHFTVVIFKRLSGSSQRHVRETSTSTQYRPRSPGTWARFPRTDNLRVGLSASPSLFMFRNMPLPHSSKLSHRHLIISFLSKARNAFIPFIKSFSSRSFLRESVRQRSEA